MLKTSRKPLLAVILLVSVAVCVVAYCSILLYSNVVHVDMQYAVVLTDSVVDSNVTLTATVTNNINPVRAGIAVEFYYSLNNGPDTYFATGFTDAGGIAQAIFSATTNGGYDFKAVVIVP